MIPNNPNYEKPYKLYRQWNIYKAGVAIMAGIARLRNEATIVWQETIKPLTIEQGKEYASAMRQAITWASANGAGQMGWGYNPGKVVSTDNNTFTKRLLFHDDDRSFVEIKRTKLGFGLYTKPMITLIDGGVGSMERANQAADSISAAIKDAMAWK